MKNVQNLPTDARDSGADEPIPTYSETTGEPPAVLTPKVLRVLDIKTYTTNPHSKPQLIKNEDDVKEEEPSDDDIDDA